MNGDPDWIRTSGLQFRKLPLYPAELRDPMLLVAAFGEGITLLRAVFCIVLAMLAGLAPAAGQSKSFLQNPPVCDVEGAIRTEITHIGAEGAFLLADGPRLRLANIVWPDHTEPQLRQKLQALISRALKGQNILWKPAAGPDRWGITPSYLFILEPDATQKPFLLQSGLVEQGIVPAWPDLPSGPCWSDILHHERIAVRARRGHWAPRAQAARHHALLMDRDLHAGRKIVALWRIDAVRPWRGLHFLNIAPKSRSGPSLSMTASLVSRLTQAGDNPREWRGRTIIARAVLPAAGLSRLRIESADHIGQINADERNQKPLPGGELKETRAPATTPP